MQTLHSCRHEPSICTDANSPYVWTQTLRLCKWVCLHGRRICVYIDGVVSSMQRIYYVGDLSLQFLHANATMPQSHGRSRGQHLCTSPHTHLDIHICLHDNPALVTHITLVLMVSPNFRNQPLSLIPFWRAALECYDSHQQPQCGILCLGYSCDSHPDLSFNHEPDRTDTFSAKKLTVLPDWDQHGASHESFFHPYPAQWRINDPSAATKAQDHQWPPLELSGIHKSLHKYQIVWPFWLVCDTQWYLGFPPKKKPLALVPQSTTLNQWRSRMRSVADLLLRWLH